ncbi:MAG TPA: NAD(P)-dependent oxidoreductase [Gaiellaceae bacterium]
MKLLLLDDRYPRELLAGFEVVTTPQEDVVAVLTMPEHPVGEKLAAALPALRVVGTATVGFDHVDVPPHVRVVSVPDYCTEEVADHTLALLLALLRGVVAFQSAPWDAKAAGPLRVVRGLRVGIVGLGRIGSAVAERVRALGGEVVVHDIRQIPGGVSLPELLAASDVVSLHVPLTRETRRLIGKDELALMKPDALLINTARGAVVDLDALLSALRGGRLGGAALDVLPTEPPQLRPAAPNLIVTPHAAYYSPASEERSYRLCVARVREALGA